MLTGVLLKWIVP